MDRIISADNSRDFQETILTNALHILLEPIYETVPRMRYQMLLNELDYASSDQDNTCRRVVIRGLFDSIDHLTTENYRCGFCDVCVPDLKFKLEKAAIPLQDAQVDEIAEQLPDFLSEFDKKPLQELLDRTIENAAVPGLLARVSNRLEGDSTNLAALYLAGALSRKRPGREILAFEYLKSAFNEGIKQGLSPDNLLLFYEEAVQVNAEKAFTWLTEVGGYWDNQEGLQFLIQEAAQRFGIDSKQHRILLLVSQVRNFNDVGDDFIKLKPKIETLKQGFERLS
ncbi:MAG: hypothetical protein F6J90_19560 [Moorea sp. SIOASIH]|uniref:hypothetical protein n=1 Tax=Moorena sp. SIOASIH TaxID=2607817 RepID=UPI0013BA275E|nr:hypothetical protein [Moorena sp. SIOASIH]NEO38413.1 hypothetical protein [Moorena sp. SIOASIH]